MANLPTRPIVFHSFALSGHAHRVAMFLSILGLPVERVEVELAGGEQHTPAFRASNPFRQAPVRAHALLAIMEAQSSIQDFLAGSSATLADLTNYAYIAHAPEGGVSSDGYPSVRAWLARIDGLPGFVPMKASPLARHAA